MGAVTYDRLALIRDAGRLGEVGSESPEAAVPRYPGWTVADLIAHTGRIHRRTIRVVSERFEGAPRLGQVAEGGCVHGRRSAVKTGG